MIVRPSLPSPLKPPSIHSPMITSRLTSKAQTTIPCPIRAALNLCAGDELAYTITAAGVVLTRARPETPIEDPFAAFSEWDSPADAKAHASLQPG